MNTAFQTTWQTIAEHFGLTIDAPFSLTVGSECITVPVRLRDFGADKGMLLVTSYETIAPHADALVQLGFGYSCLSAPDEQPSLFEPEYVTEMLQDWGWSGANVRPHWLQNNAS